MLPSSRKTFMWACVLWQSQEASLCHDEVREQLLSNECLSLTAERAGGAGLS